MSPAFELNPKPEIPCTCGPKLLCTHGAQAPIDTREIRIADTNPVGPIPAVSAANPAAVTTENRRTT
jgi:hypothetical protein